MLTSMPPIVAQAPRVLILGSMPGPESLRMQQYYAYPQNAFWPILFDLFGEPHSTDYACRKRLILEHRLALWDVLKYCERASALDADIRNAQPNDIADLLARHPTVGLVALNGGKAASEFLKLKLAVPHVALPSTSPAYAAMPREVKREHWHRALRPYLCE